MSYTHRTGFIRGFVFTVMAGAAACWVSTAQAQVTGELSDAGGIQLAPGETIVKSIDDASGLPVPIFDANTNQPIVGSALADPAYGNDVHGNHGYGGGGDSHGTGGSIGTCCFGGCEPGYYGRVEALAMRRRGDRGLTFSQAFRLDRFDYEWGTRVTLGRTFDCVEGYEAAFTGGFRWDLSDRRTNPAGGLNSLLTAGVPPVAGDPSISTFSDDRLQEQTYIAEYNSFEANRTYRGWDVIQCVSGLRYIDYSEEFQYSVNNTLNQNGFYRSDVGNTLIGGQLGLDMGYPLGKRLWSIIRARGGLFANFADSSVQLANNGTNTVANSNDSTDWAGLLEFGTSFRYRVGEALSLSAGYEYWYLANVATAPSQLSTQISPSLGTNTSASEDVFFHGFVFGAELKF